jgi:uncharacterized membrane protein
MKRLFIFIFAFFLVFSLSNVVGVQAYEGEMIASWQEVIDVHKDASLSVQEKIVYDFGTNRKHGIYRDIPVKYKRHNLSYNLRLTDIKVTDENGTALKFSILRQANLKRIKIGDPDKLITGRHTYIISYRVRRAINYFTDFDELYWNAVGNQWPVEIKQVRAVVNLPASVEESKIKAACYAGVYGTTNKCLSTRFIYDSQRKVKSISFTHDRLLPNQGLTVAVGWPKGIVTQPSKWQNLLEIIKDNWILALPLFTFIFLFSLWWTRGRDPKIRQPIIAQYSPPSGLTPAMVGAIIDEKVQNKDISAEIIYLATKGYLRITRLKKDGLLFKKSDWLLEKLKEPGQNLSACEQKLMDYLFYTRPSVKLSSLKDSFYQHLKEIRKCIYWQTVEKGYFFKNPQKVRSLYLGLGLAIFVGGWFLGPTFDWSGVISAWLSGALFIIFSQFLPARTKKGAQMRKYILGLKEYLKVAEKDRIKFHNAPDKTPKHFEELLPYAMVLGVEKEWAKQFKDIYNQPPDWYQDSSSQAFSVLVFSDSLNNFSSQASSTLSSAPSSSGSGGGGFSGGGFGGGGGGSW